MNESSQLSIVSYRDLATTMNEACEWLADRGLEYTKTRIGQYKKHLNEMALYSEQGRIEELLSLRDFPTLVNSTYEASELFYVYAGLSSIPAESLSTKLREILKGPSFSANENASSSNRGRNIGFELHMAARFVAAGFPANLTSDADLITTVLDHQVFVECKRPQQTHQVHSNIKGALGQLSSRYVTVSEPESTRGIVAISIGKVINPKQFLLIASTRNDLRQKLASINAEFINSYESKWTNPAERRTIGVLVHLGVSAEIKNESLLVHCHEFALRSTFTNDYGIDVLGAVRDGFLSCKWGAE